MKKTIIIVLTALSVFACKQTQIQTSEAASFLGGKKCDKADFVGVYELEKCEGGKDTIFSDEWNKPNLVTIVKIDEDKRGDWPVAYDYYYTTKDRPKLKNAMFHYRDPYTGKPGKHRIGNNGCSIKQNYNNVGLNKIWKKIKLIPETNKLEVSANYISRNYHTEDQEITCTLKKTQAEPKKELQTQTHPRI